MGEERGEPMHWRGQGSSTIGMGMKRRVVAQAWGEDRSNAGRRRREEKFRHRG
jgi:hypothetical protein